jgi:glutamine synthetase type III
MRMAIASPGNDFRLGACEAPPAIISMYLGNDMSEYLESYIGEHNSTPLYCLITVISRYSSISNHNS